MFKTCKARDLTIGTRIVNRMGDVMEVTAVVVGNVKSRYGMVSVKCKPLMEGMTGPRGEQAFQARPNDVLRLAEFAD